MAGEILGPTYPPIGAFQDGRGIYRGTTEDGDEVWEPASVIGYTEDAQPVLSSGQILENRPLHKPAEPVPGTGRQRLPEA